MADLENWSSNGQPDKYTYNKIIEFITTAMQNSLDLQIFKNQPKNENNLKRLELLKIRNRSSKGKI